MNKVWAQPLRRQLFIAILLLLVPVLDAAIWSWLVTARERTEELRHRTRVVAVTVASYLNRNVAVLDRMVEDAAVMAVEPRAVVDLFARTVPGSPTISGMLLVDSDGREVTRAGPSATLRGHPPGLSQRSSETLHQAAARATAVAAIRPPGSRSGSQAVSAWHGAPRSSHSTPRRPPRRS